MTLAEANVILFLGEALGEVCKSLRKEQIEALSSGLDMTQKVLLLEILNTVTPFEAVTFDDKRAAWATLVEAAKAVAAEGAR